MSEIENGLSFQIMHTSSYDDNHLNFAKMNQFLEENNFKRKDKVCREIYIFDPRKTEPAKLKTVLRYCVKNK